MNMVLMYFSWFYLLIVSQIIYFCYGLSFYPDPHGNIDDENLCIKPFDSQGDLGNCPENAHGNNDHLIFFITDEYIPDNDENMVPVKVIRSPEGYVDGYRIQGSFIMNGGYKILVDVSLTGRLDPDNLPYGAIEKKPCAGDLDKNNIGFFDDIVGIISGQIRNENYTTCLVEKKYENDSFSWYMPMAGKNGNDKNTAIGGCGWFTCGEGSSYTDLDGYTDFNFEFAPCNPEKNSPSPCPIPNPVSPPETKCAFPFRDDEFLLWFNMPAKYMPETDAGIKIYIGPIDEITGIYSYVSFGDGYLFNTADENDYVFLDGILFDQPMNKNTCIEQDIKCGKEPLDNIETWTFYNSSMGKIKFGPVLRQFYNITECIISIKDIFKPQLGLGASAKRANKNEYGFSAWLVCNGDKISDFNLVIKDCEIDPIPPLPCIPIPSPTNKITTHNPTPSPITLQPTVSPIFVVTSSPTKSPSYTPTTQKITFFPTESPTYTPTLNKFTLSPSFSPSLSPTTNPLSFTISPSNSPSIEEIINVPTTQPQSITTNTPNCQVTPQECAAICESIEQQQGKGFENINSGVFYGPNIYFIFIKIFIFITLMV